MMEDKSKNVLLRFFEQLDENEKILIHDYLKDKNLESLSRAFDLIITNSKNEIKKD